MSKNKIYPTLLTPKRGLDRMFSPSSIKINLSETNVYKTVSSIPATSIQDAIKLMRTFRLIATEEQNHEADIHLGWVLTFLFEAALRHNKRVDDANTTASPPSNESTSPKAGTGESPISGD